MFETLALKITVLQACVERARALRARPGFEVDAVLQDAAVMNVLRAWDGTVELVQRVLRDRGLEDAPRGMVARLVGAGLLDEALGRSMDGIAEFCERGLRQYDELPASSIAKLIDERLDALLSVADRMCFWLSGR